MSFATPRPSPRVPAPPTVSSQDKPSYRKGYRSMNGTEIKYINDWARQHQLEGDGLIPLLYDHLNKSDRTKEHRLKFVPIPDTVIFDHNFPRAWYAYDFKANEIIKRPGKMLESQSIYEYFSGEEEGIEDPCTDIVAQFFSKKSSTNAASSPRQMRREQHLKQASIRGSLTNSARSPRRPGTSDGRTGSTTSGGIDRTPSADSSSRHRTAAVEEEEDETGTSVEFFTKETLYDFVFNQKVKPDGVLQRFVVPKGQPSTMRNFMLQAVWSPLVSLVYKRTSTKRMSDHTGSSISERAATFDGPPHYSTESLVAQGTKDSLDAICKRIVKHFFITEHKPITRMVLYFKIDQLGNHILLWASSIRVGGDKLNPSYLRVPMQLAIKVDNARSCNKGDVDPDTKLLRDVLKEDVAMYGLTGDVAFAHMCRETVTGKRGGELCGSTTQKEGAATVASNEDHRSANEENPLPAPTSSSRQQSPTHGQSPDRASEHSGDSPRNSPRRFYVSSRAPFLIQDYPPEDLPVKSPRHPLHQAYLDLYGEKTAPSGENDQMAGSAMGSSAIGRQSRRKRNIVQAQQRAGTLSAAERLAKRTDKELLLAQMKEAIADCVYQAYSSTLEGATSVGLGVIPQVSVMVELDDILYSTLDQHQLKDVLELAKLIPDRTDDTMFTDQERSEFQRQQLRAATKNGVGVVGSSGRKSFLVGYDTSAQPALAGRPPPRRNPLIKKEMIKEGIDVDQLDADQRDAAVEYSQRKAKLKQEERAGGTHQQRRITNRNEEDGEEGDHTNDNTHNGGGGGYGDSSSDEDSDVKYTLINEEEHKMERYRSGMKFTVVPGTLGRGFRRDRPIAQIIRDVEDYLAGLFESADVAEDIMNRHEAATVEGEHNRQEMIKNQSVQEGGTSSSSPTSPSSPPAAPMVVPPVSMATTNGEDHANANEEDGSDANAASTTSDNISDIPTASTTQNSFKRSASTRSEVTSRSVKE